MNKGVQIALATTSVFAVVLWLIASQADGSGTFTYYSSVDEYVTAPEQDGPSGRNARVHGFVVEGSIEKDLPAGYVDFRIADHGETQLLVRYDGIDLPDLFRDGAEVVVEGNLEGNQFIAQRVMAKCPSKYETAPEGEASEA